MTIKATPMTRAKILAMVDACENTHLSNFARCDLGDRLEFLKEYELGRFLAMTSVQTNGTLDRDHSDAAHLHAAAWFINKMLCDMSGREQVPVPPAPVKPQRLVGVESLRKVVRDSK